MELAAVGSRTVSTVDLEASVREVARCMAEANVGCVVVVRDGTPVGMVTDRDLVLRVVARGRDAERTRVAEVLSEPLRTVGAHVAPHEAAARMREGQVRRLPIVDEAGALVGIVSMDDLVHFFGRASSELADVVGRFPVARTPG